MVKSDTEEQKLKFAEGLQEDGEFAGGTKLIFF